MEKCKAQVEMTKLDMPDVIERMERYAKLKMIGIKTKELQGLEPIDVVVDVVTKILNGTRNWLTAATQDMERFLFGCLRSDIYALRTRINRRIKKHGYIVDLDMIEINDEDNDEFITYSDTQPVITATDYHPKSYNNFDDQEAYYTDSQKII